MDEEDELPEGVAQILRQFPGPVIFWPTKFRLIATCVVLALMIGLFAHLTVAAVGEGSVARVLLNGILGLSCVLGELVALFVLLTGSSFMRLTAEGFEVRYAWSFTHYSWRDVDRFVVGSLGRGARAVIYDNAAKASAFSGRITRLVFGRTSLLSQTYGLRYEDMARVMNEWRKLALMRAPS